MRTGTRIAGRFVLGPAAGSGGAAIVYRAKDTVSGGDVALKVMRRGLALDARFEREARILASVSDPAVVGYVAHGRVPDGRAFLALEWIDGLTLSERITQAPIDANVAIRIAIRAARALGAVHAMGIVHRDVKPSNLMLRSDSDADVVVMDFGIARAWDSGATMTTTNVFLGTPAYAAPEQAHASTVDARADVYALGCVLFETLTGRRVFEGRDLIAVLAKVAIEAAPSLSAFRPDLPPQLAALLERTLSKKPADRPIDGAAFADALAAIPVFSAGAVQIAAAPIAPSELRVRSIVVVDSVVTVKSRGSEATLRGSDLEVPAEMQAIVERHGASLELLVNGSAIVTFSVGGATEQALSAARCAMALSAALPGRPIAVATGRGEVTRGAALGAVIDRAVALLELARNDDRARVRVDAETVALLGRRLDVEETAEGAWIRALSARATPESLGERWSCVGRGAEIEMIVAAFDACIEDSAARAVVVTAPAGMGKSRLADEALKRIVSRDPKESGLPLVLLAPAHADRTRSPLALVSEIVRAAVGVADPELEGEILPKVARRLRTTSLPDSQRTATFIAELVGAPIAEPSTELVAAREDPWLLGEQLRDSFVDWLGAEVARRPVIVVLDDLHWADDASVRLLDMALERLSDRPLLVIALARPDVDERFPRLFAGRNALKLPLEGLRRGPAEALAREILGGGGDADLVRRIVDRAAGNALFLQELLRAALVDGHADTLPDSVLAILQARLDLIEPDARRVLRAASVLSGEFAPDAVAGLLEAPVSQIAPKLDALVRSEVLARKPHATATGRKLLFFRHALIRDAAYALIPDDERRAAHRAAAEWLAEHDTRDAQRIADHFERAGLEERALPWLARAAREAMYAQDANAIVDIVDRAKHAGASGPTLGLLRVTEAASLAWRGDWLGVERACSDALDLLARAHPLRAVAMSGLVVSASMTGKADAMMKMMSELRAFPRGDQLDRSTAFAVHAVAAGLTIAGQRRLARELCGPMTELQAEDGVARASLLLTRGVLDELDGLPLAGPLAAFREAALLYGRARNTFGMASAKRYQARLLIALGAWSRALELLPEVIELTKRVGGGVHVTFAKNLQAWSLAGAGRTDEALALLAEIEPDLAGSALGNGQHATVFAIAALAAGDLDRAEAQARRADEVLLAFPPTRVHALILRGEVALRRGHSAEGLAFAQTAWRIFSDTGAAAPVEAPLRALVVAALRAIGDEASADAAYAEARARWAERTAGLPEDALP